LTKATRNVLTAVAAVIAAVAIVAVVVASSGDGDVKVRLGDDEFKAGRAETLARSTPLLFQDLLVGGRRDLVLFHLDADPRTGWLAVEVQRTDACRAEIDRETLEVRDGCSGEVIDPRTTTRTKYPVRVDADGQVIVDLTPGGLPGQGTTTVPPPTSSKVPVR
jgi:hypothetical protein